MRLTMVGGIFVEAAMEPQAFPGIVRIASNASVDQTIARLQAMLRA
jgi:hypothetical protein